MHAYKSLVYQFTDFSRILQTINELELNASPGFLALCHLLGKGRTEASDTQLLGTGM